MGRWQNIFYFLYILGCGFTTLAGIEKKSLELEEYTMMECHLETVTPLSKHYACHPHRSAFSQLERASSPNLSQLIIGMRSTNWCGYTAAGNFTPPRYSTVSSVAGSWNIPVLTESMGNTYSSTWVGIDGTFNDCVEQIGTGSDWIDNKQQNHAWFEMYPNPPTILSDFPVAANDVIRGEVSYVGRGYYQLVLINKTQAIGTLISIRARNVPFPSRNSAEWIVEAPSLSIIGPMEPLAYFGQIQFTDCEAKIKGVQDKIDSSSWMHAPLTMINPSNGLMAYPSSLSDDGRSFTVNRLNQ